MRESGTGRPYRAAIGEPLAHNAALLIDFDNVTLGMRSDLQAQLKRLLNSEIIKGKVAVQRAYADWRRYPQYIVPLSEASIDLIFAPAFGSNKKNATDIRLAIDALELVFTRPEIGTFILLSGDSDFSSLVLKLKEYGKYVIGVGIRESSSDLLIQNCDEYYGYNEITGLMKEGEGETSRRDPWELVVEAVSQMRRDGDVMRSDRLKQVMQTIDPNFDEKEAGFSRFSKFVVEAAQRGLVSLEKLENGQYGVELGDNANVPPDEEAELRTKAPPRKEPSGRPRRKRAPRRRGEGDAQPRQLTLGEAFELLRQALLVLGAIGEESTDADQVREKMVELLGEERDPVFERPRFQRLMRQAHDADIIELVKGEGESYLLKLIPGAVVQESAGKTVAGEAQAQPEAGAAAEPEKKATRSKRARTSKSKTSKGRARTSRSRSAKSAGKAKEEGAEPAAEAPEEPEPSGSQAAESPKVARAKRHPRFRRGSRGGSRKPAKKEESKATEAPVEQPKQQREARPPRSQGTSKVGHRGGGRRGRGGSRAAPGEPVAPGEPAAPSEPAAASEPRPEARAAPADGGPGDSGSAASQPSEGEGADGGGLFRRMTAALQKVVKGPGGDPESPDA